ncbi:MAG: hypothetical protein O7G32_05185 [SAR324 cluster bacterium]|nr:hypothetical protein [SAR324 cluster bacterium]
MKKLESRKLREHIALEVLSVDLEDVDNETHEGIFQLWQEEPLRLLRRQFLAESSLVAFSRRFGELLVVPHYMNAPLHPEVM